MDLSIENVEQLTLNITSGSGRPSLADLIPAFTFKTSIDADRQCPCPICTAMRKAAPINTAATATSTSTTTGSIPPLGQPWPGQGGINGGLKRGVNGQPDYYQIVAVGAGGATDNIKWANGDAASLLTEATSLDDGLANTKLLAESALDFPAAKWARGLVIDGHSDYYLPSQRELSLCLANVPEVFDKGSHWSSTQCSRNYAWYQVFDDGIQFSNLNSAELRARAVRRFIP